MNEPGNGIAVIAAAAAAAADTADVANALPNMSPSVHHLPYHTPQTLRETYTLFT